MAPGIIGSATERRRFQPQVSRSIHHAALGGAEGPLILANCCSLSFRSKGNVDTIADRRADLCIQRVLQRHAQQTPDAIAIAAPGRTSLSYQRLWTEIVDTAAVLRAFGLGEGDRVALVIPDGPE